MIRKLSSFVTSTAILATSLVFLVVQVPAASAAGSGDDKYFDHTSSELLVRPSDQIIPADAATSYTVEAWVRPDTLADASFNTIVTQSQDVIANRFYLGYTATGKIHVGVGSPNFTTAATYASVGTWTHVAVTVGTGANNIKVYVDGVLVETNTLARVTTNPGFAIGSSESGILDFDGAIDQVKVWGSALTQDQILVSRGVWQDAGISGASLISHFDFNDSNISLATDKKGSKDLTITDGTEANYGSQVSRSDSANKATFTFNRYLTEDGLWSVPTGLSPTAEVLVVGAGGGGGGAFDNAGAGGGGAGQVKAESLTLNSSAEIAVGTKGIGGYGLPSETAGTSGTQSKVGTLVALGGGGGQQSRSLVPSAGAGGTSGASSAATGGAGGGGGGNGGGGGGAAGNGQTSASGGAGGLGVQSSLSGSSITYGIGGSGGTNTSGADGTAASTFGSGGSGARAASSSNYKGGNGADGLVILQFGILAVSVDPVVGGATQAVTLSGYVADVQGNLKLVLSSKNGDLNISAGSLTLSGASKDAKYTASGVSVLTLSGTASQLNAALNLVEFTLAGPLTTAGSITAEIFAVESTTNPLFYNPNNSHYYRYVSTPATFADAKTAAESAVLVVGGRTLKGYLANITSTNERDWQRSYMTAIGVSNADAINLYIGARETADGNYSWVGGPEAGPFSTGLYVSGSTAPAGVNGAFISWDPTEPNNNGGAGITNCAVTNFDISGNGGGGYWDDVECTATMGYIIEFGGRLDDSNVTTANVTVTKPTVYVDFSELDFQYSRTTDLTPNNGNKGMGKDSNDKVLFSNVTTRNGISVDAVVTTGAMTGTGTSISNYETNTGAGGESSYFEVDIAIPASSGGNVSFTFDFYLHGTYGTANQTSVILQDVYVSAIDIDYNQYNDFTAVDGYTVSSPTYLTIANRNPATGFPADLRFQGRSGYATNDPRDMGIATYGIIESFEVKLGTTKGSKNDNLYGLAFKALPFGSYGSTTLGEQFTLTYNGNSNASGTVPNSYSGGVGANVQVSTNSGGLTRAGYSFGGWNTKADGTGTTYATGSSYSMPQGGGTLYALWIPAQYQLTYSSNGGQSAPASELRNAGSTSALSSTAAVRSGFTFGGWNTQADGNGTNYASGASFTMPSENSTLYAKWTQQTGTLAYNGNLGSTTQGSTSGNTGSTVAVADGSLTTRSGYTFGGWNTQANGLGTDYSTGASFTYTSATSTLYAKWVPILYSVSYSANGGSGTVAGLSDAKADDSITVSSGAALTRSGYTFSKWNTKADGSGVDRSAATTFAMPAENVVLYAVWAPVNYTITYDANGGSNAPTDATQYNVGGSATLSDGSSMTPPADKRLVGWNTSSAGTGTSYSLGSAITMAAANLTLYAQYVDANVKISYNGNGGTGVPAESTSALNSPYTIDLTVPTRTGYQFTGWKRTGDSTTYISSGSTTFTPTADTILVAQWVANDYTVTYDGNGAVISISPSTYAYLTTATVDSNLQTRTGYTFLGWNTLQNGAGTSYAAAATFSMPAFNVVLYAQWNPNSRTLSYSGNGGTGTPSSAVRAFDSSLPLSATVPTREGFTFTSWNTEADGSGDSYNPTASFRMPDADTTLYAQWTAVNYTLAYNANGGSGAPSSETKIYQDNVTLSSTLPTRTGFTFTGWNTASVGNGTTYAAGGSLIMPAQNVTLYAQWSTTAYLLTYDANGGTGAPASGSVGFGQTVTVSSQAPTRAGYAFDSWNSNLSGTGTRRVSGNTFAMPAEDVTLYAVWVAQPVSIRFSGNGGSGAPGTIPTLSNSQETIPSTLPVRPGFTFLKWNTAVDGSGEDYDPSDTINPGVSDVTLYAQWQAITYSITYDANGGSGSVAATTGVLNSSQTIAASTGFSKSGFRFVGWNTSAAGTGTGYLPAATKLMPLGGMTLYATWISSAIEIAYNDNGGSGGPGSDDAIFNSPYTVSTTEPQKTGFTFDGWQVNGAGAIYKTSGTSTFTPTSDVLLVAKWAPVDYTLSYDANGGSGTAPGNETLQYQVTTQLPEPVLTLANSTFLGWNTAANGSGTTYSAGDDFIMPAVDTVLYAQWSPIFFLVDYNPAGGTGEPSDQFAAAGQTVVVPSSTPSLPGYDFAGWEKPAAGTLSTGATFTMPSSNLILVAQWTAQSLGGGVSLPQTPIEVTPSEPDTPDQGAGEEVVSPSPEHNEGALADTGFESGNLAFFGGALIAIGAVLTSASRRRAGSSRSKSK